MRRCSERRNTPRYIRYRLSALGVPSTSFRRMVAAHPTADCLGRMPLLMLRNLSLASRNFEDAVLGSSGPIGGFKEMCREMIFACSSMPCAFRGSSRIARLHIAYKAPGCCAQNKASNFFHPSLQKPFKKSRRIEVHSGESKLSAPLYFLVQSCLVN